MGSEKPPPPFIERVIASVSPSWALRRATARAGLGAMAHYEAATLGRRSEGWHRPGNDADGAARGARKALRDIGRDLVRNNEWARSGVRAISSNLVGAGVIPRLKDQEGKKLKALDTLVVAHCETTAIDADGLCDLYGLQSLIVETVVVAGECLVRRRRRRLSDGYPLPMQVQVLEPDYLDSSKTQDLSRDGQMTGYIREGVEFDLLGNRVAYWLFDEHPGAGQRRMNRGLTSRRVGAEDVAHIFFVERPGQMRGVSWLASAVRRLQDFGDYEDAQLMRQKIAACFAAFEEDASELGPSPLAGAPPQATVYDQLEPGMIGRLAPGRKITFGAPPGVEGYGEYAKTQLQALASALGITYEALTSDYSNVNFSSGRMGWLAMQRNLALWHARMIGPQLCGRLGGWLLEALALIGQPVAGAAIEWTRPRREMIDPVAEGAALRDAVRAGQKSFREVAQELGKDPEELAQEIAGDLAMLASLGVILDIDAAKVSRPGQIQPSAPVP